MADTAHMQHPPALKVGGRRLSVTTKHKTPSHVEVTSSQNESKDNNVITDYPRPAPPSTADAPLQQNHQHDEVPPKKEKADKKMQETAHWKAETTRPTRETYTGSNLHGTGMRISQPAGKVLGT